MLLLSSLLLSLYSLAVGAFNFLRINYQVRIESAVCVSNFDMCVSPLVLLIL